jgi:small GTP-binding protein
MCLYGLDDGWCRPRQINFTDEVTAAVRVCDGVLLVVDAVEGVMLQTERIIKHALQEGLPIVMVVNKVRGWARHCDIADLI